MAFKLDKENTGFKPLEEGEYEVYPVAFAKEVAKNSGNKLAQFNYIVRDDVDQPSKGQKIRFDNFVETEAAMWRVNQASEAVGLDMDKDYASIYEWAEDFKGKAVRVVVGHREYNGKTFPEVKSFKESAYGGEHTPEEDNKPKEAEKINIKDDDLPF